MSLAYRTGTIAVPNAGTTVTGTLTAWINQVKQGDLILLPDGILYEVAANPTVNTTLTIVEPYAGTTVASGGAYAVYRFSDGWRPTAEVNIRLGTLLDRFESTTGFILNGTGVPSDALGEDGDLFIRTDVPSLYSKESGTWSFAASLGGDTGATGPSYAATSTTSRTLGTGSMTVTTQTGLAYVAGTRVRLSSAASPTTHYMEGVVTAYDTGTGSLTFTSDLFAGSGSRADWNLSLAGDRGTQGATGAGYAATSTTSLLIGTGTKAFTTQTGLGYTAGQRARASSAANTANFMEGRVASYSGGTLTLTVDVVGGSGTLSDWSINVSGSQGIQGIQGDDGIQGIQGVTGASYAATSTTSLAIGTGAKASTTQTGLAYVSGSRVRMASAANTSNYMEGICTAYNSGTGAITIDVEIVGGSGTYADWNFSLAGNKGDAGDGFSFEDDYNAGTTYSLRDVVLDQNSTWIYINVTPGSGNAPPTLPTAVNAYWKALAVKGTDGSGAVNSVNSQTGDVVLEAGDISVALTPTAYTSASANVEGHLAGINDAIGAVTGQPFKPGGRLTLTTLTPVLAATTTGAATVYYTLYEGNIVPLYNGTIFVPTVFTEMSNVLANSSVGKAGPAAAAVNSNYDLFVWDDAGTMRLTRGPAWTSGTSRGTGAGTTERERVLGWYVNKYAITNGPAAQRGTYVGTIRTNSGAATVDMNFGGISAGGTEAKFNVWNMYNRVSAAFAVGDSTNSWTYSSATFRAANGSNTMRVSFVTGEADSALAAIYNAPCLPSSSTNAAAGVALDSTSVASKTGVAGGTAVSAATAFYNGQPVLGSHYLQAVEASTVNTYAVTFYGDAGSATIQNSLAGSMLV